MADDVVGHKGIQSCPVGDVCSCREKRSYVSDGDLGGGWEAEHEEPGDEAEGVEGDEWAADAVSVSDEGGEYDWDDGPVVGLLSR